MEILKQWLNDLRFRTKIVLIVMVTSISVLAVTIPLFVANEIVGVRSQVVNALTSVAEIISENSKAALLFEDKDEAEAILRSLKGEPHIIAAYLYDRNGLLFASFLKDRTGRGTPFNKYRGRREQLPSSWKDSVISEYSNMREGVNMEGDHIDVFRRIYLDETPIGALYIAYSREAFTEKIRRGLMIGGLIFLASAAMAFLISRRLHTVITKPVEKLTDTMRHISEKKDFKERVEADRRDELGLLISSFNEMLDQLKARDDELTRYKEHLEELVEEKTAELREATRRAEAASSAKSAFLASMSHELRTPLNAIIGFSEVILDRHFGEINSRQEEYLNDILNSARHLLSLLNDILDISKIEAGKMTLNYTYADPLTLIDRTMTMVKERAHRKNISVSVRRGEVPDSVKLDDRKIMQVLFNLLTNATKFTPPGGEIGISIDTVRMDEITEIITDEFREDLEGLQSKGWDHYLMISVSDNGPGVSRDAFKRIFEPFQQEDPSVARRYGGTGLGLSLSKEIVELHNGLIWVESRKGEGSVFRLVIPLG